LRGILNDWGDRESLAILQRCADAAGRHGRIVVLKSVVPDGEKRALTIEMVLCGGKQRTVSEFGELAGRAGLALVRAERQKSYFVVECRSHA